MIQATDKMLDKNGKTSIKNLNKSFIVSIDALFCFILEEKGQSTITKRTKRKFKNQ